MSRVSNTIAFLKACQAARAAGIPVSLTRDPAWLLDMAIGRRAGWAEDRDAGGICQPVNGKLPRRATTIAQWELQRIAGAVRSKVRVYESELGSWRRYLARKIPGRFVSVGDDQ